MVTKCEIIARDLYLQLYGCFVDEGRFSYSDLIMSNTPN